MDWNVAVNITENEFEESYIAEEYCKKLLISATRTGPLQIHLRAQILDCSKAKHKVEYLYQKNLINMDLTILFEQSNNFINQQKAYLEQIVIEKIK
jgi:hypothetical protein